jgi:hypothetical protein
MESFIPNKQWSEEKNYLAERASQNAYKALEGILIRNWKSDKDIAMLIAKNNGYVLKDFNRKWYKDREVAIEAIGSNMSAFTFCPDEWKEDKSFVLDCAKKVRDVQSVRDGLTHDRLNHHFNKGIISNYCSQDIRELCKDKDPIQALEAAIRMEKMQEELKPKAPSPKRGLKI